MKKGEIIYEFIATYPIFKRIKMEALVSLGCLSLSLSFFVSKHSSFVLDVTSDQDFLLFLFVLLDIVMLFLAKIEVLTIIHLCAKIHIIHNCFTRLAVCYAYIFKHVQ